MTKMFKRAIALAYDGESDSAPQIMLKGDALDADQIVALAKSYGVPVIEKKELAQALELIEAGEQIPESLYRAVAIVLAELEKSSSFR